MDMSSDMNSLKERIGIIEAELTLILALTKYCENNQNAPLERIALEELLSKYECVLFPEQRKEIKDEWRLDQ